MFDKAKMEEVKKEVAAYDAKREAAKAKAAAKGKKVERKENFVTGSCRGEASLYSSGFRRT